MHILLYSFFIFLHFNLLFSNVSCGDSQSNLPKNIVQDHIKNNADFSIDPCDDFYAHVCPATTKDKFMEGLMKIRNKTIEEYKKTHSDPLLNEFNSNKTLELGKTIQKFIASQDLKKLCIKSQELMTLFALHTITTGEGQADFKNKLKELSCEQKADMIQQLTNTTAKFEQYRKMLDLAVNASIAHSSLEQLDQKVRRLFQKLKSAVSKHLNKTPWVEKNGGLELYQDALNRINFTTFDDIRGTLRNAKRTYGNTWRRCMQLLVETYSEEIEEAVCEVIAVGESIQILRKPAENIYSSDKQGILVDKLQMWNSRDDRIYIGNDFMILANTDYLSDLYGSIGFSLTHEIFHTLVFDYMDIQSNNSLVPFWTTNAGCVEEQTRKTCESFPITCINSMITFEEDAADLAAYRLVWDVYQKAYSRKTVVPNYESLDNKQLFFYGAAVIFCDPGSMNTSYSGKDHSNNYQRVNSLMSQMDEFADAFKCKSTDRMILNKAQHCELYGEKSR